MSGVNAIYSSEQNDHGTNGFFFNGNEFVRSFVLTEGIEDLVYHGTIVSYTGTRVAGTGIQHGVNPETFELFISGRVYRYVLPGTRYLVPGTLGVSFV